MSDARATRGAPRVPLRAIRYDGGGAPLMRTARALARAHCRYMSAASRSVARAPHAMPPRAYAAQAARHKRDARDSSCRARRRCLRAMLQRYARACCRVALPVFISARHRFSRRRQAADICHDASIRHCLRAAPLRHFDLPPRCRHFRRHLSAAMLRHILPCLIRRRRFRLFSAMPCLQPLLCHAADYCRRRLRHATMLTPRYAPRTWRCADVFDAAPRCQRRHYAMIAAACCWLCRQVSPLSPDIAAAILRLLSRCRLPLR